MNKLANFLKPTMVLAALLLAIAGCGGGNDSAPAPAASTPTVAGAGTGVGGAGRGPAPVNLGSAGNYVILAETAITNIPSSMVTGDVGSTGTGAAIHLTCPEVTGVIYQFDAAGPGCFTQASAALTTAVGDKGLAYTDANGRAPDYTELGAGNIGGLNLGPATYKWGTGVLIPTNVTLTGGANDVWIFQIAQGLTVSPGVQIMLAGGALPQNIFWATFAAADFDTTTQFKGVVMSASSVVLKTGATVDGRLLAGTQVTLDRNAVTQP
jgi:Ice-binding-like